MAQVQCFSLILTTFVFKVKPLAYYLIFEYLVNGKRQGTLLLPSNRKSHKTMEWRHCECLYTLINSSRPIRNLLVHGQQFLNVIISQNVKASSKMHDTKFTVWQLPTNDTTGVHRKCCTSWPGPKLSRLTIWNVKISETMRSCESKNAWYDFFYRFWYSCRMASLRILYCMTLT